jgi:lipooligosaccharide transport system ATP-binding protein
MTDLILDARNLEKTFAGGVQAVRGVSFGVRKGTCVGLLGPNGAGKTTTMRMLMGLTQPSGGTLAVFGTPVAALTRAQRGAIGMVPQENNLDPDLTVRENLYVYGRLFGQSHAAVTEKIGGLLAMVQLEDKAHARVNQLSGGMKRRLIIARALVNDPELIILDEPTTGLDPQARVALWQLILALIDHGKVLDEGSPKELIGRHVPPQVIDVTKPLPASMKKLPLGVKQEDVGDSVLYFTDDPKALLAHLPDDHSHLQRPANLEDVFLLLTGRTMRE